MFFFYFFLLFLLHTRCPYLYPRSFIFFFFLIQERSSKGATLSLSLSLSLSLDSRMRYLCKSVVKALFSLAFSSRFGRMKIVGSGEKTFSRVFLPPHFPSFAKQWKTLFSTLCFPSSLFSPQPNTVLELERRRLGHEEEKVLF